MTKEDCINAIAAALPQAYQPNAQAMATGLLERAVLKLGRKSGAWNSEAVSFNLTSGKSVYEIGSDILGQYTDPVALRDLWRSDTEDWPIPIYDVMEFNKYARGSETTGEPRIATIHSSDNKLEIYPIPDASYEVWGYIQREIKGFNDIPEKFHDVLIDEAIAILDPRLAVVRANEGLKELAGTSPTKWEGNTIPISRNLGVPDGNVEPRSWDLRGDR